MRFVFVLRTSAGCWGRRLTPAPSSHAHFSACLVVALGLAGSLIPLCSAAQVEPLAHGQVVVRGAALSIYDDGSANDARQTVNLGERAEVRTCFGVPPDSAECGALLPGDPRVRDLEVRADLRGPELPVPRELVGLPGGSLQLPGFQQAGDYSVENIRLVDEAGNTVAFAQPSIAVVHVREIVLASARVRALTLDELRARGIAFDAENFQAFDFRVGFAFEDVIVEYELPVAYGGFADPVALGAPSLVPFDLDENLEAVIRRWRPPTIRPFLLKRSRNEKELPSPEETIPIDLPLLGAIVLPGTVTVLNQYFEAQILVANGAGLGDGVTLNELEATIRLPSGALRVEQTEPAGSGAAVPIVRADGSRLLVSGEEGAATWILEGLRAGSHVIRMDLGGQLERPGRDPLPLASVVQATVDVVDPRFHLTFTHPDVVNEGQQYSLFVTVTNLSSASQNLVTVQLLDQILTGARKADPLDDLRRAIDEIGPGGSATVEYPLVAEITGRAVASAFEADASNTSGSIRFVTGVGELGIPLSPATLVLSRYTSHLRPPSVGSDDFLDAQIRLLSLLHGLATAPTAWLPANLPIALPADVARRAEDLGEAGQRVFLQDRVLETLEVLLLDLLGNRTRGDAFDQLTRTSNRGAEAMEAFSEELRRQQGLRGLAGPELFEHLLSTTSYAAPFIAAFHESSGDGVSVALANEDTSQSTRFETLPYAAVLPVSSAVDGTDRAARVTLIGRLEQWDQDGSGLAFRVRNDADDSRSVSLELAVPFAGGLRHHDFGTFTVPPGAEWILPTERLAGGLGWLDAVTQDPVAGPSSVSSSVPLPPFRAVGAVQDFRFGTNTVNLEAANAATNIYGTGVLFLFNRPPGDSIRELASSFHITGSFDGFDTAGEAVSLVLEKPGAQVYVQPSERVVAVRFSQPVSALQEAGDDLIEHDLTLASTIVDRAGNPLLSPAPTLRVESSPEHVGGLVTGRLLRGDGTPVQGARITLARLLRSSSDSFGRPGRSTVGESFTDADGHYGFDFVEAPHWVSGVLDRAILTAEVPAGPDPELQPAVTQEAGISIRLFNRVHRVNLVLVGRGAVEGTVRYEDGSLLSCLGVLGCPTVQAHSPILREAFSGPLTEDGSFRIGGVPVGPVSLRVVDAERRSGYQTVSLANPGQVVTADIVVPRGPPRGTGEVIVRVTGREYEQEESFPVEGAKVGVYSDGNLVELKDSGFGGIASFQDVPEGRVTIQAAEFALSRSAAITTVELSAGEVEDVTLLLETAPGRTVTGSVLYDDPFSGQRVPVVGALIEVAGAGRVTTTDAGGRYRLDELPVQSVDVQSYTLRAVDLQRRLQGRVQLPPILPTSPDVIEAQPIVFAGTPTGTIDGVVLDELGRPVVGATVFFERQRPNDDIGPPARSASDGSFSIPDIRIGTHQLIAAVGSGLAPGPLGSFGEASVQLGYAGQRAFVTIRMVGGGTLRVKTRTALGPSQSLVYYRPTYFSLAAVEVTLRGEAFETSTDPNGDLLLPIPVGGFQLLAYNPFSGEQRVSGRIEYPGQIVDLDIEFPSTATVAGTLRDVDGITPVVNAEVTMLAGRLAPQRQTTDPLGRFRFELVPPGPVRLESQAVVGSVLRFASLLLPRVGPGSDVGTDLVMQTQGTVRGRVLRDTGPGGLVPVSGAQVSAREGSAPRRRIPAAGTHLVTNSEGRFEVSGLTAGPIQVTVHDPLVPGSSGRATVEIDTDWQVVTVPDIVLSQNLGEIHVSVRDPESGATVPDALVTLDGAFTTVAGSDGVAVFVAVPLGVHRVSAFDPPTVRSGRAEGLRLDYAGQVLSSTVSLDQRGEVRGTLFETTALATPVGGASVQLSGTSDAGQSVRAFANTEFGAPPGQAGRGRFSFPGIPEGAYRVDAVALDSPRRGAAAFALTATAPIVDLALVLEAVGDVYFRVFELLSGGAAALLPDGLLGMRVQQSLNETSSLAAYDYVNFTPVPGTDLLLFPDVLLERRALVEVEETGGEVRTARLASVRLDGSSTLPGTGSSTDPFRVTLDPKGVVRVRVRDSLGQPASSALVTLRARNRALPGVADAAGEVTFFGVPAGPVTAEATAANGPSGGSAEGEIVFDDDAIDLVIELAPAVRVTGVVLEPFPDDVVVAGPQLPAVGIAVQLDHSLLPARTTVTDEQGRYSFDGLLEGAYNLDARSDDGSRFAASSGVLIGPDGYLNEIPPLTLDGSTPRILSIAPAPGAERVSRSASVEILFSESLDPDRLPPRDTGAIQLLDAAGVRAAGVWSSDTNGSGRQVVRFAPTTLLQNDALYSLTIRAGPTGIRDRSGRPLATSGSVGSSFRTSDTVGPSILGVEPDLSLPVDPTASIRVDFSEAVIASDTGPVAKLFWIDGSGVERNVPIAVSRTRQNFSVRIDVLPGLDAPEDTGDRRLVIDHLEDALGNAVSTASFAFRIYDGRAPRITLLTAPAASDGVVRQGAAVRVVPTVAELDQTVGDALPGDLDRVDYYLEDPTAGSGGAVGPVSSARSGDFALEFVASYVGDGSTPRPFPVWARAVDSSSNQSNTAFLDLEILPNAPPSLEEVRITVLDPPGQPFRGAGLRVEMVGIDDEDAAELTVRAELLDAAGTVLDSAPGTSVLRPTGGWAELAPPVLEMRLPEAVAIGSVVTARGWVVDAAGAQSTADAVVSVAADEVAPRVLSVRTEDEDGTPTVEIRLGESFRVLVEAEDGETRVSSVQVEFDRSDLLPATVAATSVPGSANRFVTALIPVPIVTGAEDVVVTARVLDLDGNEARESTSVRLAPEPDPEDPVITWRTPWREQPGTMWPAGYASPSGNGGTPLLLRAEVVDQTRDGTGQLVPGDLALVEFYGPTVDGNGDIVLASAPVAAGLVEGSGGPGRGLFEAVWQVPDSLPEGTLVPFSVRVVDTGGRAVTLPVTVTTVIPRRVYETTVSAVLPEDDMSTVEGDPAGPVFLLDGATLSVFPAEQAGVPTGARQLDSMVLLSGGEADGLGAWTPRPTTLTVPEVTSRASVVTHHPLDLRLDGVLQIGQLASIDLDGRGLRGNTSDAVQTVGGATAPEPLAGGSHGGLGWRGRFEGPGPVWDGIPYQQPGSIFGNVRNPTDPGSGGTGDSTLEQYRGGSGGGVFVLSGDAAIVVEGGIRARGLSADGTSDAGSGAGGSLNLSGRRMVGRGVIDASGGGATDERVEGSGGGGRIAIRAQEVDERLVARAHGARNRPTDSTHRRTAGAGTVLFETLDGAGSRVSSRLLIDNPVGGPVNITPLPTLGEGTVETVDASVSTVRARLPDAGGSFEGELAVLESSGSAWVGTVLEQTLVLSDPSGQVFDLRLDLAVEQWPEVVAALPTGLRVRGRWSLDEVSLQGTAWLAVGDELDIAGVVDDPSAVIIGPYARIALRHDRPEWQITALPASGEAVRPGSVVDLSGGASHGLGVDLVSLERVDASATSERLEERLPDFSTEVGLDSLSELSDSLFVPFDAPPGPMAATWTAVDADGREGSRTLSWNVLPNELPTLTLTALGASPGDPATVVAGFDFTVRIAAQDLEGLARVELELTGPVLGELQRSATVSGATATVDFLVSTQFEADGSQPITLSAVVVDRAGTEAGRVLTVAIQPNRETRINWNVAPGASREIRPGTSTVLQLDAEDFDGLALATVDLTGAVETAQQVRPLSGTSVSEQFTVVARDDAPIGEIEASVEVLDAVGGATVAGPVVLQIVENLSPTGTLRLTSGQQSQVLPGATLPIEVSVQDEEGLDRVQLRVLGPIEGGPVATARSVSGTSAIETFSVSVDRRASADAEIRIEADVTDAFGATVALEPILLTVLADVDPPQITVTDLPDSVRAGEELEATISLLDEVGVERLSFTFEGQETQIDEPGPSVVWRVAVPPDLVVARVAQLEVRATDYAGNEASPVQRSVRLEPDLPPTVEITDVRPASPVLPGTVLEVDVTAADDVAVQRLSVAVTDAVDGARIVAAVSEPDQSVVTTTFRLALPGSLPLNLDIEARAGDGLNQEAVAVAASGVATDVTEPTVILETFPAGDEFVSGNRVTVVLRSTDDVGVQTSRLFLDGALVAEGAGYVSFDWETPVVATTTPFEFSGESDDFADPANVGTSLANFTVRPNRNTEVPTVEFECPSTGVLLPEGYEVTLQLRAEDDEAVQRIEVYEGGASLPFAQIDGSATSSELLGAVTFLLGPSAAERYEIRAVAVDYAGNLSETTTEILTTSEAVDLFDDAAVAGGAVNDWAALESEVVVLRGGVLTLDAPRRFAGLLLLDGATVTHPSWSSTVQPPIDLTIDGPLTIECGAGLDVSGRGYPRSVNYPGITPASGTEHGGSHLGEGGIGSSPGRSGETFGSVYWPEEAGGSGISGTGAGGGVVAIAVQDAVIDGGLVADGATAPGAGDTGGAGGSIRLDAIGALGGRGVLSAQGGAALRSDRGSGAGGSVAVLHGGSNQGLMFDLNASGSSAGRPGGAGTIYRYDSASRYGDLRVDNAPQTVVMRSTVLPSLGSGSVLAFDGIWMDLDRAPDIPRFFVNHFVRLMDGENVLGEWRVAEVDGIRVRLDAEAGELSEVEPGIVWEGIYLFDSLEVANGAHLESADPIEVAGTHVIRGLVETRRIVAQHLVLESGATLRHPLTGAGTPERLDIDVAGTVVIEPGAAIDVSALGYGAGQAYPGFALPSYSENGGSHLGEGGVISFGPGATYGSVSRPQEPGTQGASGGGRGGGVLRLRASSLQLVGATSAIRANGGDAPNTGDTGGAGGSIWISVSGEIAGAGVIEARGGGAQLTSRGAGGGGAISIEYGSGSGTVLRGASAAGGVAGESGAAGTILLRRSDQRYGDLIVDNGSPGVTERWTELPSLGSGSAAVGSGGTWLETGLPNVAPFFVGHWVEVRELDGTLRGRWRIRSISGGGLELEDPDGGPVSVQVGDGWHGLYLFDSLATRGRVRLDSDDAIEFVGSVRIEDEVTMRSLRGSADVVVASGATLRHPLPTGSAAESLDIGVAGALVIEAGASIDVSALGYGLGQAYPGYPLPSYSENGGSHLGEGGLISSAPGATYGSISRPQEPGTQGTSGGGRGGGVLRLRAGSLRLLDATSAIRANGGDAPNTGDTGGAGGSIWISVAGEVTGAGVIEARGGGAQLSSRGAGGGGAIAIEYESAAGTVIENASAAGGAAGEAGGAGTVLLRRPDQLYGDLILDNGDPGTTERWTRLPSLGSGSAASGSHGAWLDSGGAEIADFHVGHWVEVRRPDGTLRGRWRVRSIVGGRLELEDPRGGAVTVQVGDRWQGLYLFDSLLTRGQIRLDSDDLIEFAGDVRIEDEATMRSLRGSADVVVASGATLRHPLPLGGANEGLDIEVTGTLVIEPDASIDVSRLGFGAGEGYPGYPLPTYTENGGSHLGEGGVNSFAPGATYGSVSRPQEPGTQGTSGGGRGGGVLRLRAGSLQLVDGTSAIRANGGDAPNTGDTGGAGGSIWLTVSGEIGGAGVIEARGGGALLSSRGAGGGGAVSIEYGSNAGTVLEQASAAGGPTGRAGAAGTVLLRRAEQPFGQLLVDNEGVAAAGLTHPAEPGIGRGAVGLG